MSVHQPWSGMIYTMILMTMTITITLIICIFKTNQSKLEICGVYYFCTLSLTPIIEIDKSRANQLSTRIFAWVRATKQLHHTTLIDAHPGRQMSCVYSDRSSVYDNRKELSDITEYCVSDKWQKTASFLGKLPRSWDLGQSFSPVTASKIDITLTSQECWASYITTNSTVWFNSFFRLKQWKHKRSAKVAFCEGKPSLNSGFHS